MQEMLNLAALAFLPAGVIAALGFATAWIWRRNEGEATCCAFGPDWSALGVTVAFLWGYLVINQTWLPNPGRGIINWLPYFVILGLILGPASRCCSKAFLPSAFGITLILLILFFVKIVSAYPKWSVGEQVVAVGGTGLAVVALVFANLQQSTQKLEAWKIFLAYGLVIAAAIPSFFIAGSSKWAQVIAVAGLVCVPGFLIAIKRGVTLSASGRLQLTTILWALVVYVYFFTDYLPIGAFLIFLLGPSIVLWILSHFESRPQQKVWLAVVFVGLGILGVLAVVMTKAAAPTPSSYY